MSSSCFLIEFGSFQSIECDPLCKMSNDLILWCDNNPVGDFIVSSLNLVAVMPT